MTSCWAKEHKVKISWTFTEAGHVKSAADRVGEGTICFAQNKQVMEPDTVISSAADVKEHIETPIDLSVQTKEDIENVKKSMPEKIGALLGATWLHELLFEKDGKKKKKDLPNEIFYKQVKIKSGRIMKRKETEKTTKEFMEESETIEDTTENDNREEVDDHEKVPR